MCIVSNVYDDFNKRFPTSPWEVPRIEPYTWPNPNETIADDISKSLQKQLEEAKKFIEQFREAKELAKRLDILLNQPDCVDPDKAKLEKRIEELEKRLDEVAKVIPAAQRK